MSDSAATDPRDINDLFDDIVLTEEKHARSGFEEGVTDGHAQGNQEGYQLGYAQGVQLGQELGDIYGQVVAHQQLPHSSKINRALEQLRTLIDKFPRVNDPNADIIEAVEHIRTSHRRLRALLGTKAFSNSDPKEKQSLPRKDYSF